MARSRVRCAYTRGSSSGLAPSSSREHGRLAFTPVQKLSITSGAAMVLLAAVGLVAYLSTSQLVDAQRAAAHTNEVVSVIDRVRERTLDAEAAVRRHAANGSAQWLIAFDSARGDVEDALDSLRTVTEDHPGQRRLLDSLSVAVGAQFRDLAVVNQARKRNGADSAARVVATLPSRGVGALVSAMRNEEVRVLGERSRVMAQHAGTSRVLVIAGSLFAFVLALIALQPLRPSVERSITQRLSRAVTAVPDDEPK